MSWKERFAFRRSRGSGVCALDGHVLPEAHGSAIDIHDPDGLCRHGDDISVASLVLRATEEAS